MDDKRKDYSKKSHHHSPRLQSSYDSTSNNEKSQNKTYPYEKDSLSINEQNFAKLYKIFDDAYAEFTSSDLEEYSMTGRDNTSSQSRNYKDKKINYDGLSSSSSQYRKHYQPVDTTYNKYLYSSERRPSQPEFYDIANHPSLDRASSEKLSPKSYAALQRRYERVKQNEYHSRSNKFTSGQKYGQFSDNEKYSQDTINDNNNVYEEIRKNNKGSYASSLDNEQMSQSSSQQEFDSKRTSTRSLNSDILRYGNDYYSNKTSLNRPMKLGRRKVSNASDIDYSDNSSTKSSNYKNIAIPQPLTELEKHAVQRLSSSSKIHYYESNGLIPPTKSSYRDNSPIRSQSSSPTTNRKERLNEVSPKNNATISKDGNTPSLSRSDIPDRNSSRQQLQQPRHGNRSISPSTRKPNYNVHHLSPSQSSSSLMVDSNNINSNNNTNNNNNLNINGNNSGSLLFGNAEIKKSSSFTLSNFNNNKSGYNSPNHHNHYHKYSASKDSYNKSNTTPYTPDKQAKYSPYASSSSIKSSQSYRKNSADERYSKSGTNRSHGSSFSKNGIIDESDLKNMNYITDIFSGSEIKGPEKIKEKEKERERDRERERERNRERERERERERVKEKDERKLKKESISSIDRVSQFFKRDVPESYKSVSSDTTEEINILQPEPVIEIPFPMPPKKKSNKIEYEPRKFLYKGRVWQVINSSQAKDRYLFLFNDILIITKPMKNPGENTFKYQTKSILECKRLKCTLREERMSLYEYSKYFSHPAIIQAIHRFASNSIKALKEIIEQNLLPCTPDSISYFLHCAPNLSKRQIGYFLGLLEHTDILESYLTDFPFRLLSIDESFRLLLQSLTLPQDALALDHLLEVFSKKWYEENKKHLTINLATTLRIVYSILELNSNLHDNTSDSSNTSSKNDTRTITLNKFITSFSNSDGTCSASPDILTKIYKNIEKEKLETSMDIREERKSFTLSYCNHRNTTHKHTSYNNKNSQQLVTLFPSRLSQKETSDYITITIPEPDPNIQIRIFGQDLYIEPSILHFKNSNKAQFRVKASKSQGRKLVMFYKLGANATKYYSLEPKCIVIEPAFLRYSFGMEYFEPFPDNSSVSSRSSQRRSRRKRYLFAVKDKFSKEDWLKNLEPITIPKEKIGMNGYPKKKRRRRHSSVCSSIADPSIMEETNESFSDLGSVSGEIYNSDDECELVIDISNDATSFVLKEKVLPSDGPFITEKELIDLVKNNGKLSLIIGWLGELASGHRTLKS